MCPETRSRTFRLPSFSRRSSPLARVARGGSLAIETKVELRSPHFPAGGSSLRARRGAENLLGVANSCLLEYAILSRSWRQESIDTAAPAKLGLRDLAHPPRHRGGGWGHEEACSLPPGGGLQGAVTVSGQHPATGRERHHGRPSQTSACTSAELPPSSMAHSFMPITARQGP